MEAIDIKTRYFALDGLRGTAFLLVFIGHILAFDPQINPYLTGVIKYGVWIFFSLSSFLLSNYFIRNPEKTKSVIEWGNYLIRRFFRIYPLYIIVLFIYFLYKHEVSTLGIIWDHLILKQSVLHFWTIPVEFIYYLILPLVIFFFLFAVRNRVIPSLVVYILFVITHQFFYPATNISHNSTDVIWYLPVFLAGTVAAIVHNNLALHKLGRSIKILFDSTAILIGVSLILSSPFFAQILLGPLPRGYLGTKFVYIGIACAVFILCILHGSGFLMRFFEKSILRFFGKISYSGYLIHWVIIQIVVVDYFKKVDVPSVVITVIMTIIASTILHYLIERPFMKINLSNLSYLLRNKDKMKGNADSTMTT